MEKIQKLSKYFIYLFNALLIGLPIIIVIKWMFIEAPFMQTLLKSGIIQRTIITSEESINLTSVVWSNLSKGLGFLADGISLLPLYGGMIVMRTLFKNYYSCQIFSWLNARLYHRLACLFIIDALLVKPVYDMLISLALTFNNVPGKRYIFISFGTPNLEAIFIGAVIFVISWIMQQASLMHEEQKLLV